ncbi:unnamed protein product [Notodromas monacha]|uniref:Uncharacterized protein n=1 Tax=Notodromas monacha TaxID=399045 RepID=A0A7R9GI21_9CRUS|nr:unnamed protein product [Notodromas monacha]CAG0922127.1 unnamed protein product [Notodromas monacha]
MQQQQKRGLSGQRVTPREQGIVGQAAFAKIHFCVSLEFWICFSDDDCDLKTQYCNKICLCRRGFEPAGIQSPSSCIPSDPMSRCYICSETAISTDSCTHFLGEAVNCPPVITGEGKTGCFISLDSLGMVRERGCGSVYGSWTEMNFREPCVIVSETPFRLKCTCMNSYCNDFTGKLEVSVCDTEELKEIGKRSIKGLVDAQREWRHGQQPSTPQRTPKPTPPRNPPKIPAEAHKFIKCVKIRGENPCPGIQPARCTVMSSDCMDKVATETITKIKCALQEKGASLYGIPGDISMNYIHLFGQEVWCERSKVSLELRELRRMLAEAEKEAEEAFQCSENAMKGICPGAGERIDALIGDYKRIQGCLKHLRDRRVALHKKARELCKTLTSSTEVLYEPLGIGIRALLARRGGHSPMDSMFSNLATDMARSAETLFSGQEMTKCRNFFSEVGQWAIGLLQSAAWASVSMCEWLQLRGPQFPGLPKAVTSDGDEERIPADEKEWLYADGPSLPKRPTAYRQWAVSRDAYLLYSEASHFREASYCLLVSHGFTSAEAALAVPAFPEKHRKKILERRVNEDYLNGEVDAWRGRWVVQAAILSRRFSGVKSIRNSIITHKHTSWKEHSLRWHTHTPHKIATLAVLIADDDDAILIKGSIIHTSSSNSKSTTLVPSSCSCTTTIIITCFQSIRRRGLTFAHPLSPTLGLHHNLIIEPQTAQWPGQKAPPVAPQWLRQPLRSPPLHHIHQHHNNGQDQTRHQHCQKHHLPTLGQCKHAEWEHEEHDDQIRHCEPPVLCCDVSQHLGQSHRPPHGWYHRAACRESLMWSGPAARAARTAVDVVPTLEPRHRGYMRSRVTRPMPANGVRAEVKTELDWTRKVMMAPNAMAM